MNKSTEKTARDRSLGGRQEHSANRSPLKREGSRKRGVILWTCAVLLLILCACDPTETIPKETDGSTLTDTESSLDIGGESSPTETGADETEPVGSETVEKETVEETTENPVIELPRVEFD